LNPYLDSGGAFSEENLVWDSAKLPDGHNTLSTVSLNGRGKTYCEVSVDNKKSVYEHIGVFGRCVRLYSGLILRGYKVHVCLCLDEVYVLIWGKDEKLVSG